MMAGAGYESFFLLSMPRPTQISSLLPCFFFDGGASQLFFFSCAPPGPDFLSSSLLFLCRRGITGFFLIPMPRLGRISPLLPCFFFDGGAPQASFAPHAPPGTAARPAAPILTKTATAKPLCEIRRLCRRRTL